MEAKFSRVVFACLIFLLGLVMVVFYSKTILAPSGNEIAVIQRYLSKGFQIAPLIGGLGMMVVGVFVILTNGKQVGCGHDHGDGEEHDHDHDHGELSPLVALLIVCVPVGISVANTKHDYSLEGKTRLSELDLNPQNFQQGAFDIPPYTLETLDSYKTKNVNGAYIMEVRELFAMAGDPTVSKVLDGIDIEVEGAVRNAPDDPDNPSVKRMYRMFMTCCAADMQAIPIKLELNDILAKDFTYAEHSWLKVEGKISYETDQQGIKKTVVKVERIEQTVPPDNEYLQIGGSNVIQEER